MFCKGFGTLPLPAILVIVIMGKVRCFLKDLAPYHSQPSWSNCYHREGEMFCKGFGTLPHLTIMAIVIMGKVRCFVKDLSPYHTKPSFQLTP